MELVHINYICTTANKQKIKNKTQKNKMLTHPDPVKLDSLLFD